MAFAGTAAAIAIMAAPVGTAVPLPKACLAMDPDTTCPSYPDVDAIVPVPIALGGH